jgi:hypothetical protein
MYSPLSSLLFVPPGGEGYQHASFHGGHYYTSGHVGPIAPRREAKAVTEAFVSFQAKNNQTAPPQMLVRNPQPHHTHTTTGPAEASSHYYAFHPVQRGVEAAVAYGYGTSTSASDAPSVHTVRARLFFFIPPSLCFSLTPCLRRHASWRSSVTT